MFSMYDINACNVQIMNEQNFVQFPLLCHEMLSLWWTLPNLWPGWQGLTKSTFEVKYMSMLLKSWKHVSFQLPFCNNPFGGNHSIYIKLQLFKVGSCGIYGQKFVVAYVSYSTNRMKAKYNSYEGDWFIIVWVVSSFSMLLV
jgi:hypothetical protein